MSEFEAIMEAFRILLQGVSQATHFIFVWTAILAVIICAWMYYLLHKKG